MEGDCIGCGESGNWCRCGMWDALQIIYTWPNGREEMRYERVAGTADANELIKEVEEMKARLGDECPYSYRIVEKS